MGQSLHVSTPGSSWNWPGLHWEQIVLEPVVLSNIWYPLGHVEHNLDDALLYWFDSHLLQSGRPLMGANVLRGQVSQDSGSWSVTWVRLLYCPIAHVTQSFAVAL